MEKEFNVEQIFDLLDGFILNRANKHTYFDHKDHFDKYLDLKEKYFRATRTSWIDEGKDLPTIYLELLEFVFKYDYLEIPYIPSTSYVDEHGLEFGNEVEYEDWNMKINFTREMLEKATECDE